MREAQPEISISNVHGTLSSLKLYQNELRTAMDIVTDVAMDVAESQGIEENECIKELENMIFECAKLDREINHFVDVVQQVTKAPEARGLVATVKKVLAQRLATLSDDELHNHQKVLAFKDSVKNCESQAQESEKDMEQLDEDFAVTQSQVTFTCPLTQVDMVKPVKNLKCNHHYEEAAILGMIKTRRGQKKKCHCPVVGCGNMDVTESDLILDQLLRRKIQAQKKQNN